MSVVAASLYELGEEYRHADSESGGRWCRGLWKTTTKTVKGLSCKTDCGKREQPRERPATWLKNNWSCAVVKLEAAIYQHASRSKSAKYCARARRRADRQTEEWKTQTEGEKKKTLTHKQTWREKNKRIIFSEGTFTMWLSFLPSLWLA